MSRRSWNRRAGANTHAREVRGKHLGNRWKEGDYWAECQRCGHDVYGSTLREDGYVKGLLVCPKCYDPPHPQDYIRVPVDKITPDGPTTGVTDYDTTGVEGSTDVPASTLTGPTPEGWGEI